MLWRKPVNTLPKNRLARFYGSFFIQGALPIGARLTTLATTRQNRSRRFDDCFFAMLARFTEFRCLQQLGGLPKGQAATTQPGKDQSSDGSHCLKIGVPSRKQKEKLYEAQRVS
jgi:hypothetical protein